LRANSAMRCAFVGCRSGTLMGQGSSTPISAIAAPNIAMFFMK